MTEDAKKLAGSNSGQTVSNQPAKAQASKPAANGKGKVKQEESLLDVIRTVVSVVAIVLVVRTFIFEPFNIPSGSMKPTLLVGDFVFVSKFSYGYSKYSFPLFNPPFSGRLFGSVPKRGDVMVFRLPRDPSIDYIKRVVGLPGDRLQMIDGVLNINGDPVKLQPMPAGIDTDFGGDDSNHAVPQFLETLPNGVQHPIFKRPGHHEYDDTQVYVVPPGNVFAMGDNRDNSLDSRVPARSGGVDFVPLENLIGRAEIRWFSFDDKTPWYYGPFGIRYSRLFSWVS